MNLSQEYNIEFGVPSWVRISPCQKYIACGTSTGYLYIISIEEKKILKFALIHTKGINDGVWSSDSKFIVTASDDKMACITETQELTVIRKLIGHRSKIFCVAISPDNSRIATGSKDTAFCIWDPRNSNSLSEIGGHTEPISSISFNYDGTLILTSSFDGIVRVWDSISLICLRTYIMEGHPITRSLFAPNSQFVTAFSTDNLGQLIEIKTGKVFRNFRGHVNSKYMVDAGYIHRNDNSDGELWVSSEDQKIHAWNVQSGEEIWQLDIGFDLAVANSTPDGSLFCVGGNIPGIVRLYTPK
ncbi:Trp-Asp repeats containing protein, putative [Trichomonas vaginalis G3]|uniref:Trp-Asp repeats containing protein, putative n=1 Tax=Trichomonas vaginalis (strain ATCC PRA-98 / G3) TaxID=412133 RepID=A2G614_TRIV3|nr:WD repeat-containing protein family [Trichomonas vaginalis G3]EAX87410.1 Trp-Asp repeats containing protein, putative [Trichomonas vaginalis G3]KAI5551347.1 WD repeat-containing protein family [Trichomonas vaginalis G3]|eukprot:XP_001300340.1 Trp-Asp repeats containing protein [Trichomonas vaginalis G3]